MRATKFYVHGCAVEGLGFVGPRFTGPYNNLIQALGGSPRSVGSCIVSVNSSNGTQRAINTRALKEHAWDMIPTPLLNQGLTNKALEKAFEDHSVEI